MRQRLQYFAYAGFNGILIAAALAFALYVSGGDWIVKERGGVHQQKHDKPDKQRRLRQGRQ